MGAECDIIFKILFRPEGPEGRPKDGNENRKWGERDMELTEHTISSETIFEGKIITVQRDMARLPDGTSVKA